MSKTDDKQMTVEERAKRWVEYTVEEGITLPVKKAFIAGFTAAQSDNLLTKEQQAEAVKLLTGITVLARELIAATKDYKVGPNKAPLFHAEAKVFANLLDGCHSIQDFLSTVPNQRKR